MNISTVEKLIKGSILLDVSMFANHPTRTGIQRMLRAFACAMEGRRVVPIVVLPGDRVGVLPLDYLHHCLHFFDQPVGSLPALRNRFHSTKSEIDEHYLWLKHAARPIGELDGARAHDLCKSILNWDYTFHSENLSFYFRRLEQDSSKVFNIVIDFLLWTHFECFSRDAIESPACTKYLMMLRRSKNLCFISEETRAEFLALIAPGWRGNSIVCMPGGDALGVVRGRKVPQQNNFVVIGTIEERKHSGEIRRVFEKLIASGAEISVSFMGTLSKLLPPADREQFLSVRGSEGPISWFDKPSDDEIKTTLGGARALVCISSGEGFGAPPLEALSLGVPCITSSNLPSVRAIGHAGQIVIEHDDWVGLEAAILKLTSPQYARTKQEEIAQLSIPRWADFAEGVLHWAGSKPESGPQAVDFKMSYAELEVGPSIWHVDTEIMSRLTSSSEEQRISAVKSYARSLVGEYDSTDTCADLDAGAAGALRLARGNLTQAGSLVAGSGRLAINAQLTARWRLHDLRLLRTSRDFLRWLAIRYLGRELTPSEEVLHLGSRGSLEAPIQTLIAFATCEEASLYRADPLREDWSVFLQSYLPYQLILTNGEGFDDVQFIDSCYLALLGRAPSVGEREQYLELLKLDQDRKNVLMSFLTSDEHLDRVSNPRPYFWAIGRLGAPLTTY